MVLSKYPEDGIKLFESEMPTVADGDIRTICQLLDFYDVNIYRGQTVRATSDGGVTSVRSPDGPPLTTMEWPVTAEALYWDPRFFFERYQLPIVVIENGMANCDWIHRDGKIHDLQ